MLQRKPVEGSFIEEAKFEFMLELHLFDYHTILNKHHRKLVELLTSLICSTAGYGDDMVKLDWIHSPWLVLSQSCGVNTLTVVDHWKVSVCCAASHVIVWIPKCCNPRFHDFHWHKEWKDMCNVKELGRWYLKAF